MSVEAWPWHEDRSRAPAARPWLSRDRGLAREQLGKREAFVGPGGYSPSLSVLQSDSSRLNQELA